MKFGKMIRVTAPCLLLWACAAEPAEKSGSAATRAGATNAEILHSMEEMADKQMEAFAGQFGVDWINGTFFVGLARLSHLAKNPRYIQYEFDVAKQNGWEIKTEAWGAATSPFHADNQCVAQMYIDLAVTQKQPAELEPLKKSLDEWVNYIRGPVPAAGYPGGRTLWWWCDALYMAPPGLARFSVVTGDKKYIDEMDKQYWITYGNLYDKQEHLFYRDATYISKATASGKKVFWARGNGWVFAGLANLLTVMPKDYPTRPKYETLFKEMAEKLAALQQSDGMWRSSLLDAEQYRMPETSGTGFYCYGTAWGINNGFLDKAKYKPVVDKAWEALVAHRRADGLIGWVQAVGTGPGATTADGTKPYAVGAYLQAGAEIIKMREK